MIIEAFFDLIYNLNSFIFSMLPSFPDMPDKIINSINNFLDLIFNNAGLLGLFLPLDLVKVILPLTLIVINFDYIYGLILWVLKKIPFINVN